MCSSTTLVSYSIHSIAVVRRDHNIEPYTNNLKIILQCSTGAFHGLCVSRTNSLLYILPSRSMLVASISEVVRLLYSSSKNAHIYSIAPFTLFDSILTSQFFALYGWPSRSFPRCRFCSDVKLCTVHIEYSNSLLVSQSAAQFTLSSLLPNVGLVLSWVSTLLCHRTHIFNLSSQNFPLSHQFIPVSYRYYLRLRLVLLICDCAEHYASVQRVLRIHFCMQSLGHRSTHTAAIRATTIGFTLPRFRMQSLHILRAQPPKSIASHSGHYTWIHFVTTNAPVLPSVSYS